MSVRTHTIFVLAFAAGGFLVPTPRSMGEVWAEEAKFTGTDSEPADFFGWSVAVSGDRVIVGATQPFRSTGVAYIFRRDDNGTPSVPSDDIWLQEAKLFPSGPSPENAFGASVSISGDWAFVGAARDDDGCPNEISCNAGALYVFRRIDNDTPSDPTDDFWIEEQKLIASDAARLDHFGSAVSVRDDRAVVGASGDDSACPGDEFCNSGAAYVFRRDDNGTPSDPTDDVWIEEAKLIATDTEAGDAVGGGVSISGDRVVVGAKRDDDACPADVDCDSGSAYVFRRDDNGTPSDPSDDLWVEEAKLTAPDAEADDRFGQTVSISGGRIVVGALLDDDACPTNPDCNSGSAYVFRLDGNGTPSDAGDDFWVMEAKLAPDVAILADHFGYSVSMDASGGEYRVIVGSAPDISIGGVPGNPDPTLGSAHVFRLSDNATPLDPNDDFWFVEAKLTSSDLAERDAFGVAVAIDGRRAVVGALGGGALNEEVGAGGAAYVFATDGPAVPTVSAWGIVVMLLLLLTAATIALGGGEKSNGVGRAPPDSMQATRAGVGLRYCQVSLASTAWRQPTQE